MIFRTWLIATAFLYLYFIPPAALADTVFLKNGNTLKVEKAWQENDQVWFIFSDIKASIPQSKVIRIEIDALQPAENLLPNSINKTAGAPTDPQQLSPPKKPLFLHNDGLEDMKLGSRLADASGLEIKQTDSGLKDVIEYVRPSDSLILGDAILKSVIYAFWRDRLYTVSIWTQGRENYNALCDLVFDHFGKGARIDGSSEKYLWSDSNTDIMLEYTSDDQYGLLWMRSKKLDRKLKLSKFKGHASYMKRMKSIR